MTLEEKIAMAQTIRSRDRFGPVSPEELAALPGTETEIHIPVEGGRTVHVYEERPDGLPAKAALVLNFHGGGFIKGRTDRDRRYCCTIMERLNALVWDVDYCVAPEAPFPAAVEETYGIIAYAFDHAEKLGVDPAKIILAGHSAGGNLVAAACLKNAESQPVFEPTQSLHTQVAGCYYEYNGRLHKGNIRTRLFAGYSRFCLGETEEGITTKLICRLDIDNTSKQVCRSVPAFRPTKIRRVASYPDYRAVQFAVMVDDPGSYGGKCLLNVKLDACEGNNYAYAVGTPSGNAKYPCIKMSESPVEYEQTNDDDTYIETNRVQVSATNNLFSLPFANSYRFGVSEERIIAIATVVDELSATRFGAFPLYVFTDRGVWSLESGTGEVLYSNILPVNHDQIINPNTCTALETVFYITSRGVHNLRGRSSQLISRQIERYTGELTEYLKTAQICFQFKYGDLIVYNPEYPYAYVYSLASGFWSSRDMTGRILNNGQIIMRGAIALLGDETMSCSVDCRIVTRPLKFGTTDFKRLETAVVRIMSQDCFVHVIAEGSNDCRTWITLRDVWCRVGDMDARFRRTSTSFKFLRFKLHLTANERLSMTGVDVEWYPRFTKRLR